MTVTIGRRELLVALGGAAAAWPLATRAQQGKRMRRIGVLMGLAEDDPDTKARLARFRQGLETRGWLEDRNVRIDYRFAPAGAQAFAKARPYLNNAVQVFLADSSELFFSSELFLQFRRGNMLQVSAANQVLSFSLDGTSALLPALLDCVRQETTSGVAQTNPFGVPQTPPRAQPSRDSVRAEAALTAANVLGAAGIGKFSFGSLEDATKFKADAVWMAGALTGMINIFENAKLDDPTIPSILIGEDAKSCGKGAFLSGSLPDSDGKEMLRIFTSFQREKKNMTVYYLAVPRPKGGIYLFTTMSDGSQEEVKEADSGLRTAVFKVVR